MILGFFTRQFNFFDRFEDQIGHAVEAARFFKEVVTRDRVQRRDAEQDGPNRASGGPRGAHDHRAVEQDVHHAVSPMRTLQLSHRRNLNEAEIDRVHSYLIKNPVKDPFFLKILLFELHSYKHKQNDNRRDSTYPT
jgi:hypothetical protein